MMSRVKILLALRRQLSAENIAAQRRTASTRAPTKGGRAFRIAVVKACSGRISGKSTLVPRLIKMMRKAKGMISLYSI